MQSSQNLPRHHQQLADLETWRREAVKWNSSNIVLFNPQFNKCQLGKAAKSAKSRNAQIAYGHFC